MRKFFKKNRDLKILLIILVLTIFFIIKGCNYDSWTLIPNSIQGLLKKTNNDLWYNLSIGYVISFIFYLVVNFFPELKRSKKIEEDLLPLRCARYREVELLMQDISMVGGDIFNSCLKAEIINRNDVKKIDDLFNIGTIKATLPYINLSKPATIYNDDMSVHWLDKIKIGIEALKNDGNIYLTRYKDMVPTILFLNVFYIINNSFIFGQLPILLDVAVMAYGYDISLEKVIYTENNKEDIDNSCKYIIYIDSWLNNEYEYLIKNYSIAKTILKKYDF